tara:strand:+ start:812 stop:1093 length:282 start_codon:yes stop_codon:yes gene_type:complete
MNNQDWETLDNLKNDLDDVRFGTITDQDEKLLVSKYLEERKKTYEKTRFLCRQDQKAYEKILPTKPNTLWNEQLKKDYEKSERLKHKLVEWDD